jgi:hypothetical protein
MSTESGITYKVLGTTDEVTSCDVCGKLELKGTIVLDADGEIIYAGFTCGAKLAGKTVKDIRSSAKVADQALRDAVNEWSSAHTHWTCEMRDAALGMTRFGKHPGYAAIKAYYDSPEFVAANATWLAANPKPTR